MSEFKRLAETVPVTMMIALAWITGAFLTDPFDPKNATLLAHGALRGADAWNGGAWRLLAHSCLHGGILHLAVNTMSLLSLGPVVERSLGPVRFVVLYAVTAIAGGLSAMLVQSPLQLLVGGSGALFGMCGAVLALLARSGRHAGDFFGNHTARLFAGNVLTNLVLGFLLPMVSNAAHIGGLVAGFALVFLGFDRGRRAGGRGLWLAQATTVLLAAGLLVHGLRPVTRWDYNLVQWGRTPPGPRRDGLKAAFFGDYEAFLRDAAGIELDDVRAGRTAAPFDPPDPGQPALGDSLLVSTLDVLVEKRSLRR